MRRQFVSATLVVSALAACEAPDFGSNIDQGVIITTIKLNGTDLAAYPVAQFVEDGRLTLDAINDTSCFMSGDLTPAGLRASVSATAGVFRGRRANEWSHELPGSINSMLAGEIVEVRHSGDTARRDSLQLTILNGGWAYSKGVVGIPVVESDSLRFVIPGDADGFPATEIVSAMVPNIVVHPIPVPAPGNRVRVTWSPAASVPGAYVIFRLDVRASDRHSPWYNASIHCRFVDDGEGFMDSTMSARWIETKKNSSTVSMGRERITFQVLGPRRELYHFAVFGLPLGLGVDGVPLDTTP